MLLPCADKTDKTTPMTDCRIDNEAFFLTLAPLRPCFACLHVSWTTLIGSVTIPVFKADDSSYFYSQILFCFMATIKNGILGGISGKVGNVIGGNWNGIDYLRSVPTGVKQANTILQQSQRMKFKALIDFLRPQKELIRTGFHSMANKVSAFNVAVSYNYHHALAGDFDTGFSIDYSKALLASGNLPYIEGLSAESTTAGQLNLSWTDNSDESGAAADDILYVDVYNPTKGTAVIRINPATRSAGSVVVNLPAGYSGDIVHCYAGFFGIRVLSGIATRNTVSSSMYIGPVTVA